MPLDPQAQALLEQMKMMGFAYSPAMTVGRAREMLQMMLAMRGEPEPVGSVEDRLIPGPGGRNSHQDIQPRGERPFPGTALLPYRRLAGWQSGLSGPYVPSPDQSRQLYHRLGGLSPGPRKPFPGCARRLLCRDAMGGCTRRPVPGRSFAPRRCG